MGAVYLAARSDQEFEKTVCVKLLQLTNPTAEELHQFRQERQLLARLNHPHIVTLLDGGDLDGVPYLIMDYVVGLPLDQYCRMHRLSVEAKLVLFRKVCSAVHFAHRNLIIHRDIKPTNIIVTESGEPKLLDFGVAKLMNPEYGPPADMAVTAGARMWTALYASPEQVRGRAITSSSDIYSLGVVLYELLSGSLPLYQSGMTSAEFFWALASENPLPPSQAVLAEQTGASAVEVRALETQIAGDLDCIALKALEKDPERRYASVEHLSEDVRRFLEKKPVKAHPLTATYLASRFAARHRPTVIVFCSAVVLLAGATAAALWQASVAQQERVRAERRFEQVRDMATSFIFDFHEAIAGLPGATDARRMVVKKGLEHLDALAKESEGDLDLQLKLARAYQSIGLIQRSRTGANLGDTAGAQISYHKSLDITEAARGKFGDTPQILDVLAGAYSGLGDVFAVRGKSQDALPIYQKALKYAQVAARSQPEKEAAQRACFRILAKIGDMQVMMGDIDAAQTSYAMAGRGVEEFAARFPNASSAVHDRLVGYHKIAFVWQKKRNHAAAIEALLPAVELAEKTYAANPRSHEAQHDAYVARIRLSESYEKLDRFTETMLHGQRALEIAQAEADVDANDVQAQYDVTNGYLHIGDAHLGRDRPDEAARAYRLGLESVKRAMIPDPQADEGTHFMIQAYSSLGEALLEDHDVLGAFQNIQLAVSCAEAAAARLGTPQSKVHLVSTYHSMAELCERASRWDEAAHYYSKIAALPQQVKQMAGPDADVSVELAKCRQRLARR